jgi:serine/threonine-protein kinase
MVEAPGIPRDAIAGYLLDRLIGRGGMGSVYLATQLSFDRPVAIKVLHEAFRDDVRFVARFKREANMQATLEHPHIVPVLESGEGGFGPFIVMRLIEGPSLKELIRAGGLSPPNAIALLTGIGAALDHAHAHGALHRDVKPHNILVEDGSHAWLADFGLTRMVEDSSGLTSTGGLLGTFDYLAPEIARGEPATVRSDVYSLAVTTFQAITGVLPFPAANHAQAVFAHASAQRPHASDSIKGLPVAVDAALMRGMAIEAHLRPPSAGALLDNIRVGLELERISRPSTSDEAATFTSPGDPGGAWTAPTPLSESDSPAPTSFRPPRRTRLIAVGLASLLVMGAGASALALGGGKAPHALNAANSPGAGEFASATTTATGASVPGQGKSKVRTGSATAGDPDAGKRSRSSHNAKMPGGAGKKSSAANHAGFKRPTIHGGKTSGSSGSHATGPTGSGSSSHGGSHTTTITQPGTATTPSSTGPGSSSPPSSTATTSTTQSTTSSPPTTPTSAAASTYGETTGSVTHTWSDYADAGGGQGPSIPSNTAVQIECKVTGFKVEDGDTWWYRIASSPWSNAYYASADAFYNNGETSGSLQGTPFVDSNVPSC